MPLLKIYANIASLGNMMAEAITIPAAYSLESSGDSLLRVAYIQATAVLEIKPPKIAVSRIPRLEPTYFTRN